MKFEIRTLRVASLDDLKKELWLRRRNRGILVWKDRQGNITPIKDMEDSHLINTINYLEALELENSKYDDLIGLTLEDIC